MAQAMEKSKVIELLEYYKDIDGEVSIYRKIITDLTDQYYNPIREYEEKVQQLQNLKAQMLQEISRLKLKEKRIIFDFYIHNLKWERVAERNAYSERQCKNIRDNALETLSQRFGKNQIISQFHKVA